MAARKPRSPGQNRSTRQNRSTGQKKTAYVVTGSFAFGPYPTKAKAETTMRKLRAKSKKIQIGRITGKRGAYRFGVHLEFLVGTAKARDQVKAQIKKSSPKALVSARKVNI